MKSIITIASLAITSSALAAAAPNKGKNQTPHTGQCQVGIRVEYYELDHATLHSMVSAPTDQTDASAMRREILAKVALGEASLIQSSYVVARSGQRAKVESILEWIYPTEFDSARIPQELSGPVSSGTDLITPTTPTAFETRNVGHTLEVDPVIGPDGLLIELNLAPELVVYLGENKYGREESQVEQPVFHSIRDTTSLTLRSGTWAILGVHSPPPQKLGAAPDRKRRVVSLVRTDIIDVGNAGTTEKSQGWQKLEGTNASDDPFAEPDPVESLTPEQKKHAIEAAIPKQIAILCEWVELDALTATKLLDQHAGGWADAAPLRAQLEKMITKKHATLVDSSYVVTRSGQRAKSESVNEFIYPTEMDPSEIPQKLSGPLDPSATITTHGSYTAFETRHVGTTVEVDPVIGADNITIDVNIAPQIVALGGMNHSGQAESRTEMPLFYAIKDSVAFTSHDGTSVLVGMHSPMPKEIKAANFKADRRVLTIISTRIIKAQ